MKGGKDFIGIMKRHCSGMVGAQGQLIWMEGTKVRGSETLIAIMKGSRDGYSTFLEVLIDFGDDFVESGGDVGGCIDFEFLKGMAKMWSESIMERFRAEPDGVSDSEHCESVRYGAGFSECSGLLLRPYVRGFRSALSDVVEMIELWAEE